jgi:DNA-binding NarL/FixJ family response regulator
MTINIMVAEQERMTRECLVRLIEAERDLSVVGQVSDGRAAVVMASRLKPGVAVVDFNLPVMNGIETVRRIHAKAVPAVMVCTCLDVDSGTADLALQAGAAACLGQGCSREEFLAAIRRSAAGGPEWAATYVTPGVWGRREAAKGDRAQLTPREREVLQLLAEGYMTKEISDMLGLSSKTISTHRVHIKEKLGTRSVALLTKFALRTGLTQL